MKIKFNVNKEKGTVACNIKGVETGIAKLMEGDTFDEIFGKRLALCKVLYGKRPIKLMLRSFYDGDLKFNKYFADCAFAGPIISSMVFCNMLGMPQSELYDPIPVFVKEKKKEFSILFNDGDLLTRKITPGYNLLSEVLLAMIYKFFRSNGFSKDEIKEIYKHLKKEEVVL